MKLWVTPNGDRWLCAECAEELKEQIEKEQWRAPIERMDPMLRCSECKAPDVDFPD